MDHDGRGCLGPGKILTTPDNAAVTTSYNGNETTVTDPTGKKRKSISDSLGRVVSIYEDPLGANYQTIYGYNALGNLVSVAQDYLSQPPRQFVYDSLGRIASATNPESGTMTFKYDEAGNLIVKTDARGVSTHYSLDQLNRPIRRWYNGSSATTATTHNDPAIPSGVGSTNEVNYFYDQQALPIGAPIFTRGPSNGALVAMTFAGGNEGNYFGRDAVGRQLVKIQRTGSVNYQMTLGYSDVGALISLSYPSGRSVTYGYDGAGRLNSLGGNLGDGTTRTYSTAILYSPWGGITKEHFGTQYTVYNKLHYNVRGQLYDVRASNVDAEWSGELGALVNYYSTNWQHGGSGTDNNGNVLMSQTIINSYYMDDRYTYDALNRLAAVNEYQNGATQTGSQQFSYDRWGNRTISSASWGTGINTKQFTVNPYYNRLGVPGGQTGVMTYDAAGNLTNDTYTGAGSRTFDADNRLISAWGGNNQAQFYVYDPAGERIKRTVNGVETWQIYGFGGELVAEYPINGAANNPQTEYAYRNGQLLVIASSSQRQWLVADHLGTPRMIIDQMGTLSNLKRRDYLPFGEDLPAGVGGRTSALGYNADATRQGFTGYEADAETGLNYAQARYESSVQGRFISTDPISGNIADPQSWNMYSYVGNSPTNRTDPTGMSYFMGSGANDPSIRENEYRVDGFDMSPQGTASNLTDESMLSFTPNSFLLNEGMPQNTETGADLAQRAATGLSNHPGLLEQIQANTASGVDVHIVACQAAKESNYVGLSRVPIPRTDAGTYSSNARGAAGEVGLLQVKPSSVGSTADALKDVGTNVKASTSYLMTLKNHFGVGMREALAIYNWGPTNFNKVNRDVTRIYSGSLSYADKILDCSRQLYLPSDGNQYKILP